MLARIWIVTFVWAFAACDTESIESQFEGTDGNYLKSGLEREPGDPRMYDPESVAERLDVVERLTKLAMEYGPRLDHEEIELLHEGKITSQQALDLSDAEHDALIEELRPLFVAGARLLKEEPGRILEQRNNGKQPPRKGGSDKVTCDEEGYRRCLWFATTVGAPTTPPSFWPALGLATLYYCLCEYCRGGKVDSICLR